MSSHYLLSDESPPRIYRLVDENRRAWHAGLSSWGNSAGLNSSSIGIEIVNPGLKPGPDGRPAFAPFPQAQIDLLIPLVRDIVRATRSGPTASWATATSRRSARSTPGLCFPWRQLADAGLIPWPDAGQVATLSALYTSQPPSVAWFQRALARHGFAVPQTGELDPETVRVLAAFQMKYRPSRHDGQPDGRNRRTAAGAQQHGPALTRPAHRHRPPARPHRLTARWTAHAANSRSPP